MDPELSPAEHPIIVGQGVMIRMRDGADPVARFFVPRGHVVPLQDLRGRGHSDGISQYFHTASTGAAR